MEITPRRIAISQMKSKSVLELLHIAWTRPEVRNVIGFSRMQSTYDRILISLLST